MVRTLTVAILMAASAAAQAQMGPTVARAVHKPMPGKAPAVKNFTAEANLTITRKGRVYLVEITQSSGDDAFDKQWKKSLSDWRFVPAVGEDNEPTETHVQIVYKNNVLSDGSSRNVVGDSKRFESLTCKDFLWEYEIVTDALPRRLALLDPLLKTPMVLLGAETPLTAEQQQVLREHYDQIVSDAARQCRDDPTAAVWSTVLKPAMRTAAAIQ